MCRLPYDGKRIMFSIMVTAPNLGNFQRSSADSTVAGVAGDFAPNLALPWVVRLRYGMVAGEGAIILGIVSGSRFDPILRWTLLPLAIMLASNVLLARIKRLPLPQTALGGAFCIDTLCLTAILGLSGGPMNPFSLLYLVQITLSAVVLGRLWTWALGALSTMCFGFLFFVHAPSAAFQTHHMEYGLSSHLAGMWMAFVSAAALIAYFTGKIADTLRAREQEVLMLQDQVARNERLASLATLAAGAAHELGTPLGTIAVVARELERYATNVANNQAVLEDAQLIRSQVDRCRRILDQMSVESAEPAGESPRKVCVQDLLMRVVEQFPANRRATISVECNDRDLTAVLPEKATAQSLTALIQNSLDADSDNKPILITATEAEGGLRFVIRDHGHGMPGTVLRRVAEPFFTTKETGKGMGLGTFLVRTFAERLGGRLRFDSAPGKGTTATLELPLTPPQSNNHAAI